MKKMKREEIDRIILDSFQEIGDDTLSKVFDNVAIVKAAMEKDGIVDGQIDFAAQLISCIMTAQMNAVNTMRNALYKVLCEDNEEPIQPATGGDAYEVNP